MADIFKRTIPVQSPQRDDKIGTSAMGTPIQSNVTFQSGDYIDGNDDTQTWDQLTYDSVLITVSQAKKIIKTEIAGKNGTVKEYIGLDDYVVQINGVICGLNGVHPKDEIAQLKKMLDAPVPIQVACPYLQNLGIMNLVVDNYQIGQEEGGHSYQQFSITFIDDIPTELRIADV